MQQFGLVVTALCTTNVLYVKTPNQIVLRWATDCRYTILVSYPCQLSLISCLGWEISNQKEAVEELFYWESNQSTGYAST